MAAAPSFAATPNAITPAILGSAETSLTAPAQSSTLVTAAASGTLITGLTVEAVANSLTPTTVAGLIYIFQYDGTTYHLYDVLTVAAVTASTTVAPFSLTKSYASLPGGGFWLRTGWFLKASQSISGNASLLKVTPQAADY